MQEFRRLVLNKKFTFFLGILLLFNGFFFYLEQQGKHTGYSLLEYERLFRETASKYQDMPLDGARKIIEKEIEDINAAIADGYEDEPAEARWVQLMINEELLTDVKHVEGYSAYLEGIQNARLRSKKFSFLSDDDGFASKNIEKTARDFLSLENISVQWGLNKAVSSFFDYKLSNYLVIILVVYCCLYFLDEHKKGLWFVIHAAPRGRAYFAWSRIVILFIVSVLTVLLTYGGNLALSFFIYEGATHLDRAAQSIPMFKTLIMTASIRKLLTIYFLFRILSTFLLGTIIWLILLLVKNVKYSTGTLSIFLSLEYSAFAFLPVQSFLNIVKYLNIFSLIHLDLLFSSYFNINIFGIPIGFRPLIIGVSAPMLFIIPLLCAVKYSHTNFIFEASVVDRFRAFVTKPLTRVYEQMNATFFELYKILILQRSFILLIALIFLCANVNYASYVRIGDAGQRAYESLVSQLEGEIGDDALRQIQTIKDELQLIAAEFDAAQERYDHGEISYREYYAALRRYDDSLQRESALQMIEKRLCELESIGNTTYRKQWLLNEKPFMSIYGYWERDTGTQDYQSESRQQTLSLLSLFVIVLIVSGSYAFERQANTVSLIHSTAKGYKSIHTIKRITSVYMAIIVWGVVYGFEVYALNVHVAPGVYDAPINSLSTFSKYPIPCSIQTFLIILYGLRLINMIGVAWMALALSSYTKNTSKACVLSCAVIVLPSIAYLFLRINPLKYLSLYIPLNGMGLLIADSGNLRTWLIATFFTFSVGLTSLLFTVKDP